MYTKVSTRVFQIYELAELITRFTIQRQPHGLLQGRETLVVLARVDKTLSQISLVELWKVLHSGQPLISLLPLDFVKYVEPAVAKQPFSREILITELGAPKVKPQHLERYMKYSTYVQTLDIWTEPSVTYELLKKADRCIVQLGLNDPYFRKRETLSISSSWAMDSQEYREMRSNRAIKHLGISPSQTMESHEYQKMGSNRALNNLVVVLQNTVQGPWLEEISRYYSGISTLAIFSLQVHEAGEALKPESIIVLDSLRYLRALRVDIEPTAITVLLRKVRNLPLLEVIGLKIPGAAIDSDASLEDLALESSSQLRKILRLKYEGRASNFHAILVISKALFIRYESICYSSTPFSFQQDTEMVLGCILSTQPSIQAVVLSDLMKPTQGFVDELRRTNLDVLDRLNILPGVISHFAGLRQLRHLRLNTFSGSLVTPALLDAFASSLTLLKTCIFTPYRIVDRHGRSVTVVCLIHIINFILRCPSLRHLAVCFDGRKVGHINLVSEFVANGVSQFSVLDVGHSAIDDAEYVASTLQKSLPALRQVVTGERNLHVSYIMTEVEENLWSNVGRIIDGTAPTALV